MNKIKPLLIIAFVIFIVLLYNYFDFKTTLTGALDWIQNRGFSGILFFGLLYIAACIFMIPGSLLTLGAGVIYGPLFGTVIVSAASTAGALAAFFVGRYFTRKRIECLVSDNKSFKLVDQAVTEEGWKIVALTRLSPVFPFNFLNYAYGLTGVKWSEYIAASWIGMLPGTAMYVYIGSLAGSVATIGSAERSKSSLEWALYIVGLAATVIVTVYVTRIAKKVLDKRKII